MTQRDASSRPSARRLWLASLQGVARNLYTSWRGLRQAAVVCFQSSSASGGGGGGEVSILPVTDRATKLKNQSRSPVGNLLNLG